jgi:hypothetical protein
VCGSAIKVLIFLGEFSVIGVNSGVAGCLRGQI